MHPLSRRAFLGQSALVAVATASVPLVTGAEDPPARIRAGQIGTGHAHASGKWATLAHSKDFEAIGVVEPDRERRARAEASPVYAGARWMTEDELLSTPGLRLVAIETEVKDLLGTAARCLDRGLHLHLDKPAGESFPAFRQLRERAEQEKLVLQMGYMFRYHPAFALCFQMAREETLGEIFSIEASMSKRVSPGERAQLSAYRGGAMFELGCHVIDAVVQILGRPDRVTPFSRSSAADQLPDNQFAALEYPKAVAIVRSAIIENHGEARRQFTVCGTKGTFEIRPLEPAQARLVLESAQGAYQKGSQELHFPRGAGRYDGDFADLAAAIRGEKPFAYTALHDLAVQETVLRASGLPLS